LNTKRGIIANEIVQPVALISYNSEQAEFARDFRNYVLIHALQHSGRSFLQSEDKFGASRLGLCIADVSGKGMPAALLMSNLQAVVKALAAEKRSPKELVEKVNRVMCRNTTEAKFITLFYGLLDVDRKTLQYSNAGHNAPVLTREDGVQVRLEQGGVIVGSFQDSVYDQGEIDLRPGDRLVMFTDGLSEAGDGKGEEFGEERLAEASRCNRQLSAEALHRCLLDRVTDFCGGEFEDDATVLVVAVS
jgi:sigma-B regulation protein RsbU (phosphoserine phosphatase)